MFFVHMKTETKLRPTVYGCRIREAGTERKKKTEKESSKTVPKAPGANVVFITENMYRCAGSSSQRATDVRTAN